MASVDGWDSHSFLDEERANQCRSAEWRKRSAPIQSPLCPPLIDKHGHFGPFVILLMAVHPQEPCRPELC